MKRLKSIVNPIGDGYYLMLQENVKDNKTVEIFISHKDYSTWMFCVGFINTKGLTRLMAKHFIKFFKMDKERYIKQYKESVGY